MKQGSTFIFRILFLVNTNVGFVEFELEICQSKDRKIYHKITVATGDNDPVIKKLK